MAQKVTLGGERIGTGSKMTQELYNYGMNSFNQSRIWWSTMAPGLLYPCFKEIGTNHGTFDIDIDTFVRTLPTKGPLFGSFKMQVDLYNVPFRLYQGVLHNNPVDIGLHMDQVYLPAMEYKTLDGITAPKPEGSTDDDAQVSTNSLIKYLGISGAGHHANYETGDALVARRFQCVPELGYYDIFKNYYSNKQEENAYVVMPGIIVKENETSIENGYYFNGNGELVKYVTSDEIVIPSNLYNETLYLQVEGIRNLENIKLTLTGYNSSGTTITEDELDLQEWIDEAQTPVKVLWTEPRPGNNYTNLSININSEKLTDFWNDDSIVKRTFKITLNSARKKYVSDISLTPFKLKNIDKMRAKLLGNCELGDQVIIDGTSTDDTNIWGYDSGVDQTGLPYIANVKMTDDGVSYSAFNQTGLVTKTYQSDLFNNWLDNSLVDTIKQRTTIDTSNGGFTPDTLILQEKIYKYLNRVLVSGGTYYDWQEATYGEGVARMCEIPMYIGGMSTEIMFEEVIANNESNLDGKYQALGSLAGKGTQTGKKGGNNIHVRMDEPGYIIGIVSITPRISVYQGNDWDRTELQTMDDLHKPELDGIGFQDLMVEQMAWWNTRLRPGGTPEVLQRDAVGKQTAWIHYQTALDKVYGDFAKSDGYSFMVLSRQYEHDGIFGVKDLTTYIDPTKYNYAFAYQDLAAQNFWVELAFKVTSRRKMGAQQLPTL